MSYFLKLLKTYENQQRWRPYFESHSTPTGVKFTVDGVHRTTTWSGTYIEGTSVSLVMPETQGGYVWSHWLEDGDTDIINLVMLAVNYGKGSP